VIDFRYHLVSLVAIFLALTVGLVLGATALQHPGVSGSLTRLTGEDRSQVDSLQQRARRGDQFAEQVAPTLVAGALAQKKVLLVTTADTPAELTEQTTPLLEQAGATLTGRLRLLPALSAPDSRPLVADLVARALPPGLTLPKGEPIDQAGAELAAALTVAPSEKAISAQDAQSVVSAYTEADLVRLVPQGGALTRADLVLVLTGSDADDVSATVLRLASSFDDGSAGVVVAQADADTAADTGPVAALRKDAGVAGAVSGVDGAARPAGRVAAVLALAEQARGGAGQYGAGAGASAPLPSSRP